MSWFQQIFARRRLYRDLSEEMQEHLQEKIDELVASGMPREEATATARREFGNALLLEERGRETWKWRVLDSIWADLKYGLRTFSKRPAFILVAVLAIGVGISSNTAIFSVANAVLLRGLSVEDPAHVVMLWEQDLSSGRDRITFSPADYADYQTRSRSFTSMAAIQPVMLNMRVGQEPEAVEGARCSPGLLSTLGIKPFLGAGFVENPDPSRHQLAMLSYGFWASHFGSNQNILGQSFELRQGYPGAAGNQTIDGTYTVIGVLPRELDVPYLNADVLIPMYLDYDHLSRAEGGLRVFARLKPGLSIAQASADANSVARDLSARFPDRNRNISAWLVPLRVEDVGDIEPTLITLLAAVGLVLLIVCTNVANMLLARSLERRREMAVRMALGVARGRLVQQLLTESLLLGIMGTAVGLLLASWETHVLATLGPASIPRMQHVAIDGLTLAITVVTGLLISILFGLIPALKASRTGPLGTLQNRSASAETGARMRQILVTAQVALAFVVLVGSALVAKSFLALHVNLGYQPQNLLTFRLSLPQAKYDGREKRAAFFRQVLENVNHLPGVVGTGGVNVLPEMNTNRNVTFTIDGRPDASGGQMNVRFRVATPGYFRAMGTPMLRGREFDEQDLNAGAVIISGSMARQFWPSRDPVGEHVRLNLPGALTPSLPIVGVAEDVRQWNVTPPEPTIYWSSLSQFSFVFAVRTTGDPLAELNQVRHAVSAADPEQPIFDAMSMEQRLARSQGTTYGEFRTVIMAGFGLAALFLATLGIYGVVHCSVLQRTREFGIRMAVGALRRDIARMVLQQALVLVSIGSAAGLLASIALMRLLASFLYGVGASEPPIVAAIALFLGMIAIVAAFAPARRAASVDPMQALSTE